MRAADKARQMAGDLKTARTLFLDSRKQCSTIKMRDGVIQADIAARRVERLSKANEPRILPEAAAEDK